MSTFITTLVRAAACCLPLAGTATAGLLTPDPPFAHRQSLYAGFLDNRVGSAVAISGGLVAVGVPGADGGATPDVGRVDVYTWVDALGRWESIMALSPSSFGLTVTANARFGAAVAMSGDWLLIGCPGCANTDDAKAVLVRIPDTVESNEIASAHGALEWRRVTPPALAAFGDPVEGTGAAVALSVVNGLGGESVAFAIGSPAATFGEFEFGAIAMGRLDNGQVVWASGPWYGATEAGKYGRSLAMTASFVSGSLGAFRRFLVVGHPGWVATGQSGVHGRAALWQLSGDTWSQAQTFEAAQPGFLDGLGTSVAIERGSTAALGTIAVGAPGRARNGTPGGAVLVWRQETADGPYVFDTELQHPGAVLADRFGGALALAGGRLLVGADGRDDVAPNAGAAYVYVRALLLPPNFVWTLAQTLHEAGAGGAGAAFGSAVALAPRVAAIGAPTSDAAGLTNAGVVTAFLCDRIFADGVDGSPANACARP